MLLSVLFSLAISSQGTGKVVSAEVRAAPAPLAIAELSRQIGFPLAAMPATQNDILIIKVKGVTVRALMDKIAKVLHAGWEPQDGGYRLIRTDAMRREEIAEEQAKLTEKIRTSFEKMRKQNIEDGELNDRNAQLTVDRLYSIQEQMQAGSSATNWQDQQKLNAQAPAYRLIRRICPQLTPELLASIPRARNAVFSTKPNRMQRPMPVNLQPLIQAFKKEQAIWSRAMRNARDKRTGSQYYFENTADPANRQFGKVLLIVSRPNEGRGVSVRIIVADTKGRTIGSGGENIGWDNQFRNTPWETAKKAGGDEEDIVFSGTSKLLNDTFQQAFTSARANGGQPDIVIDPALRPILLNPEKTELLSLTATDAVFETARIKKLNIVACPTDMMFIGLGPVAQVGSKPSSFLAILPNYQLETESQDGWLTIQPIDGSGTRKDRTNRLVLGQYIRSVVKEGRISLDNQADYAFRSGKENDDFLPMFFLMLLGVLKPGDESGPGDWNALRLYGSLTAPQRQLARAGQTIPFRALNPAQIEIVRHQIFDGGYAPLQITYQQTDFADTGTEDNMDFGNGLDREATEILPNGFTGSEQLTITDAVDTKFFGRPDSVGGNVRWGESAFDLQGLAHELFQQERPDLFPWRNQPGYPRGSLTKVRTGTERQVTIMAKFTERASLHQQLRDRNYTSDLIAIDKLAPDIRKAIQENLAKIREQYKNAKPPAWDPGGGGVPPPPPPPSRR